MKWLSVLLVFAVSVTCQKLDQSKVNFEENISTSPLDTYSIIQKRVTYYGAYSAATYAAYSAANPHNLIPEYLTVNQLDGQGLAVIYTREQIFNAMQAGIQHFNAGTQVNFHTWHFPHHFAAAEYHLGNTPTGDGTRPYTMYPMREPNASPRIWAGNSPPGAERVVFDDANGRYMGVATHRGHTRENSQEGQFHWGSPTNRRGEMIPIDDPSLENIPGVPRNTIFMGPVAQTRVLPPGNWDNAQAPIYKAWGKGGGIRRSLESSLWSRITWL